MAILSEHDQRRFDDIAQEYLEHPQYQRMKDFIQHGTVSTYTHCVRVAQTSFVWAMALKQAFGLHICEKDLVAGALLHDFYLYDWHDRSTAKPHHATKHPLYARENAVRLFSLSPTACNIIESHMWPLPPRRFPRSSEALLVCLADKWCCMGETLLQRRKSQLKMPARMAADTAAVTGAEAPAQSFPETAARTSAEPPAKATFQSSFECRRQHTAQAE